MRQLTIAALLLLFYNCSLFNKSKKNEPINNNGDIEIINENTGSDSGEKETNMLDTSEPFYPVKESLDDIQNQINELRARVIDYETKINIPTVNTDMLKMIDYPHLQHEIETTSGNVIRGNILKEDMDKIIIETKIGQITIEKQAVVSVRTLDPLTASLELDQEPEEKKFSDKIRYSGTISNKGGARADFVRVIFYLWGEDANLIAADSAFVDGATRVSNSGIIYDTALYPNESAEYEVDVRIENADNIQYVTRDIKYHNPH